MLKISPDFPISDIDNILSGFINKNSIFDINNIIFVIEEIDLISTSFNNRELIETVKIDKDKDNSKDKNALSVILNALDGIPESNGRMIIMTTNCPEKLDNVRY
jgi:AAA+ superfamily predicted ATPase